ncbi:hypothetical protein DQ237_15015 [Blastococcus sp. TF02-8]|nr:hypothetical protein DQ237_15015 [Blastococcus sp. TF02-8]
MGGAAPSTRESRDVPDVAAAVMRLASGAVGTVSTSCVLPGAGGGRLRSGRRRGTAVHLSETMLRVRAPRATSACPLTVLSWRLGALPPTDLWWGYAGLVGAQPRSALAAYLVGGAAWSDAEHDFAQTLNENLRDLGSCSLVPHREHQDA